MNQFAPITVFCILISFSSFSQKTVTNYKPHFLQASIRAGLINTSLNVEHRVNSKTTASIDLGYGFVRLQSHYYNKFNKNYSQYDKYFENFLNLGIEWESIYSSIQIKRIINSKSKIKYNSSPYANTFTYYGIQLKFNAPENRNGIIDGIATPYRETYQFGGLFGRQIESRKDGIFLLDYYLGLGGIANYKLNKVEGKLLLGLRAGINLYKYNKK
jgi:hypothetical protein